MQRRLTAAFAVLAFAASAGIAFAQTPEPGDYQLKVGNAAPCVLTLTAEGAATLAADCQGIKPAAKWYRSGNLIKLLTADDKLVALLKGSGSSFSGTVVPEGTELTASR